MKAGEILKHINLQILRDNDINVPPFIVVDTNQNIDLSFSSSDKFAVRSSFSAEDNNNNSFAGQFDTLLNVSRENIEAAVEQVLNSFRNQSAEAYKNNKNISNINSGSVIIQEMVNSELSGVIFTANPQGILNETVIVVGNGLGNNIVEDKIDTTSYFYNQDDDIYYYEQNNNSPVLSEELLKELLNISGQIKEIFNQEMDIEFGIREDEIFILQARPITTLNNKNIIILDNSNIVESYPGISSPLTQSFVKEIYYGIFKNCLNRISKNDKIIDDMDDQLQNMVDIANGRIYYRISNWYSVLSLLPFSKKIIPMWQNMMGVNNKYVQDTSRKIPFKTKFTITCGFFHYLNEIPKLMDELNMNFDNRYREYKKQVSEAEEINSLLQTYQNIKENILKDWDLTLINDMYAFIYTHLAGEENKKYISNIKNLESMKPVLALNELVSVAKDYGIESEEYQLASKAYIDLFGDRCLGELKLETKTYRTNPELLHEVIKQKLNNFEVINHDINNDINNDNIFVRNAKIGIMNREISRMNRSRIFGLVREIFLKIGTLLYQNNQIDNKRDVFYLHLDELNKKANIKEIIIQRKLELELYKNVPTYSRLVFSDKILNKRINNNINNILNKPDELYGTAASEGIITGEVLIIDNPDLSIDTTGKILVTKSTDPGWVFLIEKAAGIIAEKGSLLSHTAIITRELGKPSIVNVKDCTKILKTGENVQIDAINGIIKIL